MFEADRGRHLVQDLEDGHFRTHKEVLVVTLAKNLAPDTRSIHQRVRATAVGFHATQNGPEYRPAKPAWETFLAVQMDMALRR